MKKTIKLLVMCALSLVLIFAFVACDKENDSPKAQSYTFEAEYAILPTVGAGWSGGMSEVGPDLDKTMNASNGYFVVGLYAKGATLTFEIEADKAVSDAKIIARFTAEDPTGILDGGGENPKSFTITKDTFKIKVNGEAIAYKDITFNNIKKTNKFQDYTIGSNISLKQGKNIIEMVVDNDKSLGGTTLATAPLVDCLKITTTATLKWTPLTSNLPE